MVFRSTRSPPLRPSPMWQVNISNVDLVMESDMGTFAPVALQFTGSPAAQKVGRQASATGRQDPLISVSHFAGP